MKNTWKIAVFAALAVAALAATAMPTKQQISEAQRIVTELTADDMRALKTRRKTPGEVAAAHLALAGEAETEAGKYLLLQGAFRLYARTGNYDAAADALTRIRRDVSDVPPEVVVELVNGEMRRVAANKAPKVLVILRDAQRTIRYRKELAAAESAAKAKPGDVAAMRRVAECHAGLGDWSKALKMFAEAGDDAAKYELDPASAKGYDILKAANYWWNYPVKDQEPFRVHAAMLYNKGIGDGSISGLHKTLAERRAREMIGTTAPVPVPVPAPNPVSEPAPVPATASVPAPASPSAANGKEISVKLATGVTLDFVPCPAGTFTMGNSGFDQSPSFKHKVTITRPFWIGKYQVTRGVWAQYSKDKRTSEEKEMYGGDNAAMVDISFCEVLGFCNWLNHRRKGSLPKGYVFRLPTEAEWEYALNANGGKANDPYIMWRDGNTSVKSRIMVTYGDYKKIAEKYKMRLNKEYFLPPMTVGTKLPNAWGIYDMLGNHPEFVLDTVDNSNWTGRWHADELIGKNVLLYKESETDPLRFVANATKLTQLYPLRRDGWYSKNRAKPNPRFGMGTTFRLVIGPDLLKERGIKLPKSDK